MRPAVFDICIGIVTSARGGIGRALAARLCSNGHRLASVERDSTTFVDVSGNAHIAAAATTTDGVVAAVAVPQDQLGKGHPASEIGTPFKQTAMVHLDPGNDFRSNPPACGYSVALSRAFPLSRGLIRPKSVVGVRYTQVTMRRSAVLLIVLFAMLWQSVTLAPPGSTVNVLTDIEHAALHWHDEGHHHQDDGSILLDSSRASTVHLLTDHLAVTTALLPAMPHHFPPSANLRPLSLHDGQVPDPFLDGLLRPPRHHA